MTFISIHLAFYVFVKLVSLHAIDLSYFIPFGPSNGAITQRRLDDGYSNVILSKPFKFYGIYSNSLYVNSNGVISFDEGMTSFTPDCIPGDENILTIFAYWADVDTRWYSPGIIDYREIRDSETLEKIEQYWDLDSSNECGSIKAVNITWAFVATWYRVAFYFGDDDGRFQEDGTFPENTFQVILASDYEHSYAIYLYNKITWTAGTQSGGDRISGLNGSPARAGFDAGDDTNFALFQASCTNSIVNIANMSNVNTPGVFIFTIDENVTIELCDVCSQQLNFNGLSTKADLCAPKGTCINDEQQGARCICNDGWSGTYCEIENNTALPACTLTPTSEENSTALQPSTLTPTLAVDCSNIPVDLLFIVDGSGSISSKEWSMQSQFIQSIVAQYNIGPGDTHSRVAYVQYSATARIEFDFNDHYTRTDLNNAIESIQQYKKTTYLGNGIKYALNKVLKPSRGSRCNVHSIVVVLIDGKSMDNPVPKATAMQNEGHVMYAIGVGKDVNADRLGSVASSRDKLMLANSFDDLDGLVSLFNCSLGQQ